MPIRSSGLVDNVVVFVDDTTGFYAIDLVIDDLAIDVAFLVRVNGCHLPVVMVPGGFALLLVVEPIHPALNDPRHIISYGLAMQPTIAPGLSVKQTACLIIGTLLAMLLPIIPFTVVDDLS